MEVLHLNASLLFVSQRPVNGGGGEQTVYRQCRDTPAVIIWYLGLQLANMFLGIPANLAVLWLVRRRRRDSSSSDIFILHLAVLDVLFCLIPPLELANILFLTGGGTWYVLRFFYGMKDSSPLFLSCICLDRYVAVLHPVAFTALKDRRHRAALAAGAWLVTLAYAAAKCAGNIANFEKVFTAMILAAFAFMVFCNTAILRALRRSAPGRDAAHPVKRRAFRVVLVILAIILCNYLPPVALLPFQHHFPPAVFRCYVHYLAFGLMDFSSTLQPLLYLSREPPRRACCRRAGPPPA